MMECVWPPQTSMIFQGRVVTWAISRASARAISPLRNSVRYFMVWSGVSGVSGFVELGAAVSSNSRRGNATAAAGPRGQRLLPRSPVLRRARPWRGSRRGSARRFPRRSSRGQSQRGRWCSRRPRPRARSRGRRFLTTPPKLTRPMRMRPSVVISSTFPGIARHIATFLYRSGATVKCDLDHLVVRAGSNSDDSGWARCRWPRPTLQCQAGSRSKMSGM